MSKLPFKVDKRFPICTREMLITFIFLTAYCLFVVFVSYGLGGKPLNQYTFIMGMPSWFFILILGMVVFIAILGFICFKVFANISIEAYIDQEERGEE